MGAPEVLGWLAPWAACGAFAAGALTDLRRREVPNAIPLLLVALFVLHAVTGGATLPGSWWAHLVVGAAFLGAGFALYLTGGFGAGDAKLTAVAGLWAGPAGLSTFLFGLGTGAFALVLVSLLPFAATRRLREGLPFAVAILWAAVVVLVPRTLAQGYP